MIFNSARLISFVAACTLSVLHFGAAAQRVAIDQKVTSELTVVTVVQQANGTEQLVAAKAVKPGDLLQYTANYRNPGPQPVLRLAATLPIPAETEYAAFTALPNGALASVNGTTFERIPLLRKVKQADGKLTDVPVPLSEYRFLRWPARDLAAGATYSVSARTRVVSVGSGVSAVVPASAAR